MADVNKLKQEITENLKGLTPRQMWTIVKLCKWVRLRARNNSAFNNLFNNLFREQGFNFREVTKQKPNGERYPGLQITYDGRVEEVESED